MRTLFAISLALCIAAACHRPSAAAPSTAVDPAFSRAAAIARTVFEGEIVDVGTPPAVWSGRYLAYQAVTYRVTRVVADRDHRLSVGEWITVWHLLVSGSETADTRPGLRPALAHPGAKVIVLAAWSGDRWTGLDEHHGLVIADAAHRAALPVR